MTNAELLAKIKAEIEKRKCSIKMYCLKSGHDKRYDVVPEQFENILSFLSTLESEKPMNPEDAMKELNEKIALVKQRGTWDGVDVDKYMDEVRGREPEKPMNQEGLEEEVEKYLSKYHMLAVGKRDFTEIARHFAQWGADNLK